MNMRNYLHPITIAYIIIGLLIGYGKADYDYNPLGLWNKFYYAWAKGVDVLLILCILYPEKEYRYAWISMGGFFLVREIWEVGAVKDYASASRPSVIFSLFLLEIVMICFIMFKKPAKRLIAWLQSK